MSSHFAEVVLSDSCLNWSLDWNNCGLCDVQLHEYVMVRSVGENSAAWVCDGSQLRVEEPTETVDTTALDSHGLSREDSHSQVVVFEVESAHSFPSNHAILKILTCIQPLIEYSCILVNNGKL